MNLDKYEKIDGREILRRLADGQSIWNQRGTEIYVDFTVGKLRVKNYDVILHDSLGDMLNGEFYAKKPFDVRQAMLDRPNEWVGKYSVQDEEKTIWYYVGFDSKNFCALRMKKRNKYGMKEPVKWNGGNVVFAIDDDLDACIPIEDVPEEATQ